MLQEINFKRNDRVVLREEKAACAKTLATLLEKYKITKEQAVEKGLKVLSTHQGVLRLEHPTSGKPQVLNASIFKKA